MSVSPPVPYASNSPTYSPNAIPVVLSQPLAIDHSLRLSSSHRFGKRFLDVLGAGLGLVFLAPLLVFLAVLVRLSSPGPSLFCQRRLGRHGKPFLLYKFRSMVADAEARFSELEALNESDGGVLFKMKRDPRVTPLGRLLRKTSLDEFPQLWNVLRGEMSLVGPRPLSLRDSQLLAQVDPEGFARRLQVTPGLTGYWQVKGRSETGFEQMLAMDLDYIREWSLGRDVLVIVQTALSFLRGRGAY